MCWKCCSRITRGFSCDQIWLFLWLRIPCLVNVASSVHKIVCQNCGSLFVWFKNKSQNVLRGISAGNKCWTRWIWNGRCRSAESVFHITVGEIPNSEPDLRTLVDGFWSKCCYMMAVLLSFCSGAPWALGTIVNDPVSFSRWNVKENTCLFGNLLFGNRVAYSRLAALVFPSHKTHINISY